jgi:hypothetical protein
VNPTSFSHQELVQRLGAPERIPMAGEKWRHYKGGLYTIVMLVRDEATSATLVIYEGEDGRRWSRAAADFLEVGPFDDGQYDAVRAHTVYRFPRRFMPEGDR